MKKNIALFGTLMSLFSAINMYSQAKNDNVWVMGLWGNQPDLLFGGSKIDFGYNPPSLSYFDVPFQMDADASICDSIGNLLFYTNGCEISTYNHTIMDNGEGLNPGYGQEHFCNKDNLGYSKGYRSHQGVIIIPKPGHINLFNVYHLNFKNDTQYQIELLETTIDMSLNNGLGKVISKNVLIKQDTFSDNLTAIRHGNGRDWWIVVPKQSTNQYYLFLLTPSGISLEKLVSGGSAFYQHPWGGQAAFSPDGSRFARIRPGDGLEIMNFDRCEGKFSSPKHISFGDSLSAGGCAFSSNSRFLYISTIFLLTSYIYQLDLGSPDVIASQISVAQWDGVSNPFATNFYQQMLAPNEKIYVGTGNGSRYFHIIHEPNLLGQACQVEQRGLVLPTYHSFPMPNFPHFKTLDLDGSICDSIFLNSSTISSNNNINIRIFPNPAHSRIFLKMIPSFTGYKFLNIELFDLYGNSILKTNKLISTNPLSLELDTITRGIYFIKWTLENGGSGMQKIVIN